MITLSVRNRHYRGWTDAEIEKHQERLHGVAQRRLARLLAKQEQSQFPDKPFEQLVDEIFDRLETRRAVARSGE